MEQIPIQIGNWAGDALAWIAGQIGSYGLDPLGLLAVFAIICLVYWACTGHSI